MKYQVLLDADGLVYQLGFALEDINNPNTVEKCVHNKVQDIQSHLERIFKDVTEPKIILSPTGQANFRFKLATIKPYKGNRVQPKPKHYELIREIFSSYPSFQMADKEEADDLLADIAARDPEHTIIVSGDKDLRQVPGWHYEPLDKRPIYYVDKDQEGVVFLEKTPGNKTQIFATGNNWLLIQMLLGDPVDNIPGIPGYGPVKIYNIFTTAPDQYFVTVVRRLYLEHYGIQSFEKAFNEVYNLLKIGGHNNEHLG